MTGFETHAERYPVFHQNKFIQDMTDKYRWTISEPKSKMPINIREILDVKTNKIHGAKYYDKRNLATLRELTDASPDIINCALYLNSQTDNYICLDIESSCPKDVKDDLLQLPYIYGETSMSGKGIHLVFPLPNDWYDNENYDKLRQKTVSREQHGWYELLCTHFVTFTRNSLDPSPATKPLEDFLTELNKTQKVIKKRAADEDYEELDISDIPYGTKIADRLTNMRLNKDPDDFLDDDGTIDDSRWEFYVANMLRSTMMNMLKLPLVQKTGHTYTHNELCTILYTSLVNRLEYRDKHDTLRNGMPYLYFTAENSILKSDG